MMRLIVWAQSVVCKVARTICPVSAMLSAAWIVSRSRSSPMRITSGSWRRMCRSAAPKVTVSEPTSRWLMTDFLCEWTNSIGSSIVTMCGARLVDEVDHAGQGRGLARARLAGDEDEALRELHDVEDRLGHADLLEGLEGVRDRADRGADRAGLAVHVHAHAADAAQVEGEVELVGGLEALALLVVEQGINQGLRHLAVQLLERRRHQRPVDAQGRRGPHREV